MRRVLPSLALLALLAGVTGCGGGDGDDSTTGSNATEAAASEATSTQLPPQALSATTPHGPHYFETPSHNIGCYVSRHDARCDIRERDWEPTPEPKSCKKIGLDYGQGIAVGPDHAEFVCAGDTSLGGPMVLAYGAYTRRGSIVCTSREVGMLCVNRKNGHGFFMSRERFRIF